MNKDKQQISDGYHTFAELYEHRHLLTCLLGSNINVAGWKSKRHEDGTMYPDSFIVGISVADSRFYDELVRYHMPLEFWDLFITYDILDVAPRWDGATSSDYLNRIRLFLKDKG